MLALAGCGRQAATPERRIDRLLEMSGLREEILQLPDHIREETSEPQKIFTDVQQRQLADILLKAYDAEYILSEIRSRLMASYSPDASAALLKNLDTPTADRMRTLERAARTREAEAAREAFATRLEREPPSDTRLELMQECGSVTGKMETASALVANTMRTYLTLVPTILK